MIFTEQSINFKPTNRSQRERLRKLKRAVENTGGYWCHICGHKIHEEDVTLDHVQPLSKGGPDSTANIKLAHGTCNQGRSNMDLTYYRMFRYTKQHIVQGIPDREVKSRML